MGVSSFIAKAKRSYREHQELAEKRADIKLERLKSKTAREKVRLQLKREKTQAKRELEEADLAYKKAKQARKSVGKKAGHRTGGISLSSVMRTISGPPARRHRRQHPKKKHSRK